MSTERQYHLIHKNGVPVLTIPTEDAHRLLLVFAPDMIACGRWLGPEKLMAMAPALQRGPPADTNALQFCSWKLVKELGMDRAPFESIQKALEKL